LKVDPYVCQVRGNLLAKYFSTSTWIALAHQHHPTVHSPVGLSFLLCIVCIAETFPILNKFLQLAPFPSKASKVALLRLLVSNVSLNYFAEYISTFLFRHDVWMARNKVNNLQQQQVIMHAADQEDILLAEERAANVSIIYVMFVFGCSLLLPQLIL
jgi:hypothetical protein